MTVMTEAPTEQTTNDKAIALIEQALRDTGSRSLVSSSEVTDLLLDLRSILGTPATN